MSNLELFLRPPGRGLLTLGSGGEYASELNRIQYGTDDEEGVSSLWRKALSRIPEASAILLGLPSDSGASIRCGANLAAIQIRKRYLEKYGAFPANFVDIGDIATIPHYVHDSMLNEAQKERSRLYLYPGIDDSLPVSPVSIAQEVLRLVDSINPTAPLILLSGDGIFRKPLLKAYASLGKQLGWFLVGAPTMDIDLEKEENDKRSPDIHREWNGPIFDGHPTFERFYLSLNFASLHDRGGGDASKEGRDRLLGLVEFLKQNKQTRIRVCDIAGVKVYACLNDTELAVDFLYETLKSINQE